MIPRDNANRAVITASEVSVQYIGADGFAMELCDADPKAKKHAFDLMVFAFENRETAGIFRKWNNGGGMSANHFLRE